MVELGFKKEDLPDNARMISGLTRSESTLNQPTVPCTPFRMESIIISPWLGAQNSSVTYNSPKVNVTNPNGTIINPKGSRSKMSITLNYSFTISSLLPKIDVTKEVSSNIWLLQKYTPSRSI